jgi:hypothetical protein
MSLDAAAVLTALAALERRHDGPLPPQAWDSLRHGAGPQRAATLRREAAALQQTRAWQLLDSAGRWRRRQAPARAAANVIAARQALASWRRLALAAVTDITPY